ncbi:MAG: TadE/TadG family type IV pilus assembly protein [Actinomycetota bacterium]
MTIMAPITVFLVLLVVQLGLHAHAQALLNAAVQDGARAAQLEGASAAEGRAVADQLLSGSDALLTDTEIDVVRRADVVEVTARARIPSVIPFWSGTVTASSSGPVERFRPQGER